MVGCDQDLFSVLDMARPAAPPSTVVPRDYPELSLLAWNRDPSRPISAVEAFGIYEGHWRHLDASRLEPHEADLIEALVETFGQGQLLSAGGSRFRR
jgi:hypothetical protein